MKDTDCVAFLQWALPRLGLRWQGLRRVRRQVCKRVRRRLDALRLGDLAAYRALLETDPEEWRRLDSLCRISISRFYRDRGVFIRLERELLPQLLDRMLTRGDRRLRMWSAGCASGEEPYSLALMCSFSETRTCRAAEIVATDSNPVLLARAQRACYPPSSLREMPAVWRTAFAEQADQWCLRPEFKTPVRFLQQDIRERVPEGPFDLILCRNLAFTYFTTSLQTDIAGRIAIALVPGGLLLLGAHESLPEPVPALQMERPWLYRRYR